MVMKNVDNRAIGVFDSGVGGLTCIPHLFEELPDERVIYFGDTARTPYGSKAVSTIKHFSTQIADFLVSNDVKMLVIACNTITCICIDELRERFPDIPIVGIVDPAAKKVSEICNNKNSVGIIATKATIESGIYQELIKNYNKSINVSVLPTPMFVPLIEEGIIDGDVMETMIKHYMDDFIKEKNIDTLILGCTHYPIIKKVINKLYPWITIINPSYEITNKVKKILDEREMRAKNIEKSNIFYASDLSGNFSNMINKILDIEEPHLNIKFKSFELYV